MLPGAARRGRIDLPNGGRSDAARAERRLWRSLGAPPSPSSGPASDTETDHVGGKRPAAPLDHHQRHHGASLPSSRLRKDGQQLRGAYRAATWVAQGRVRADRAPGILHLAAAPADGCGHGGDNAGPDVAGLDEPISANQVTVDGEEAVFERVRNLRFINRFGEEVVHPRCCYRYRNRSGGVAPLDVKLGIDGCFGFSPLMTYLICMLGAAESYAGAAAKLRAMLEFAGSQSCCDRSKSMQSAEAGAF